MDSHKKRPEGARAIWPVHVSPRNFKICPRLPLTDDSYNANVKELQDTPGSEYFAFLSRKAHEGALNQAKIDVAEARMRGEIGEAEKKGRTKQEISKIDADTAVLETKRKAEKAKADSELMNRQTELDSSVEMGKIAAKRQTEMKDAELKRKVETLRAETELERLRANDVTKSKVARESSQQSADAAYYKQQKSADASLYTQKMEADAACMFDDSPLQE